MSTRRGWFSDRSTACLAMGRLAVVLDTGFTDFLPGGAGLLAYRSPEEARETVARVRADYEGQSRAARAVAEEFFAGRRVLGDLLGESR